MASERQINRLSALLALKIIIQQTLYCTTDCIPLDLMFQENFSMNTRFQHKFGTARAIKTTSDREERFELHIYIGDVTVMI